MQLLKILTATILIFGLTACPSTDISQSKFVKQSEICQTYSLLANEDENRLNASVFFRFGGSKGTTLVLNDSVGSIIKIEGDTLPLIENSVGAHYEYSEVFMPGKKNFTYIDGDGKVYKNSINCEEFRVFNVPSELDRSEVLELNFIGQLPEASESLICQYQDTAMSFSNEYKLTDIKDNKLKIPLSVFQKMKNGPITIQFIRKNSLITQSHGSIPGYLNYQYNGMKFKCLLKGKGNDFVKNDL